MSDKREDDTLQCENDVADCVEGGCGQKSEPDKDAPSTTERSTEGPLSRFKQFKLFVKAQLFDFCSWLNKFSHMIQKRILESTLEEKRAEIHLSIPLNQMDQDLLAMYIRWNGHHVEKSVRYNKTVGRGYGKPILLRSALDEWNSRGYPRRRWIDWAEANLDDHKKWESTGLAQIHPEKNLPTFVPTSPIMEVLTNRVSTRFWKPIPVEDEKINSIIEVAAYAPTSCNRQAWKLYVRRNPNLANFNTSNSADVSNRALREKATVAIYITIDNRLYPEIWAGAEDAGIVGLQMNLAATSLGLAGCLMYGAENFNQDEFRELYSVPSYRYMYLMFLFGYPAERTLTDKRIHPDEIAIFI